MKHKSDQVNVVIGLIKDLKSKHGVEINLSDVIMQVRTIPCKRSARNKNWGSILNSLPLEPRNTMEKWRELFKPSMVGFVLC